MNGHSPSLPHDARIDVRRLAFAGFCSSLVGLGLARFAYTPLIPALIAGHWFAPADVVYLGAANLAGYLVGALAAKSLASHWGARPLIRGAMGLASLSCLACAVPLSFLWFLLWRLASGIAGALIMVLAASTILPHVAPSRRGLVGGVIFAGIGLGIILSGTLIPLLLRTGLTASWIGLGVIGLVATAASWMAWPSDAPRAAASAERPKLHPAARALLVEYALAAFALVPHMVFLVDFIARGLGQGVAAGANYWVIYGIGALLGPLAAGHLADRAGFGPALRLVLLMIGVAAILPALSTAAPILMISSMLIGALTPGIVPIALGRTHELVPHGAPAQQAAWGRATTMYALGQAGGAYGLSYLFQAFGGDYRLLFEASAIAMVAALAIDLGVTLTIRR